MSEPVARSERRHRRLTVRIRAEVSCGEARREAMATTLGGGGLFVETPEPWPRLTPVGVRFRLREGGGVHRVKGRVVFCHAASDGIGRKAGMGIEFTDAEAAARVAADLELLPAELV